MRRSEPSKWADPRIDRSRDGEQIIVGDQAFSLSSLCYGSLGLWLQDVVSWNDL